MLASMKRIRLVKMYFANHILHNPINRTRQCVICWSKKDKNGKKIRKKTRILCEESQVVLCLETGLKYYQNNK